MYLAVEIAFQKLPCKMEVSRSRFGRYIALASDVSRSVPQVVSEVKGPLTSTPKAFCVQTCPHTHLVPVENRVIQLINMLLEACVVFLLLASRASAQTVAISPSPLTSTEGSI